MPISAVAILMAVRVLPADKPESKRRIDVAGIAAFTIGAGALTFALIKAGDDGWGATIVWLPAVIAAVGFAAFVAIEAAVEEPMVDLKLLRRPSFVGALLAALLLNFAAFAALTYGSIWLQSVLGMSPIQAGLVGLPLAGCSFFVAGIGGRLLHGKAHGPIIGGGMMLIGLGAIVDALMVHSGSGWAALIVGFVITGFGVGLATPTLSSSAMAAVPVQRGGMAAGMVNTMRQLGFAIGIAVLGSVFASGAAKSLADRKVPSADETAHLLAGGQTPVLLAKTPPEARAALSESVHAASAAGLDAAFLTAGLTGLVGGVVILILMRKRNSAAQATVAAQPEMLETA